jgi:phospholipase/lecithinase/hemolysin
MTRGISKLSAFAFAFAMSMGMPLPVEASLIELTNLFVFGDSLLDGGNSGIRSQQFAGPGVVFPPPPYTGGRYSNGPTAVEYLWNSYNPGDPSGFTPSLAGGTNYAIGGATTGTANFNSVNPGVPAGLQPAYTDYGNAWQLQQYLSSAPAFDPATSLFVVWLFPNDVFYAGATGTLPGIVPGSPGGPDLVSNGIANILTTIQTLAATGAQHFLVPNMPDLGRTPAFLGDIGLSTLTAIFNANLATQLTLLDQLLPAEITQFDTAAALGAILDDPLAFGFTNTTEQCVEHLLDGQCNPNTWLFWDGVHPTTATHAILGAEFQAAVPEPATLVLMGIALAGLGFSRRKQ